MNKEKVLVMYLRISVEDKEHPAEGKEESNSIINQRNLLRDYIGGKEELVRYPVTEVCDDGYSGINLERPGMKHLLEMVKKQQVGCIIVKDFSRFGRDYLTVSDYIDQIFPFMGIRFISVNDHYDSAACNGMTSGLDVAFRNVVYGYYSQDLSFKVKSAKRAKAQNGDFTGSFAPLGYQKMPQNRNKLVVEPEGAAIVRKIFLLAGEGMSVLQITRRLNQEHIPTPCQIKNKQGKFHKWWNGKGKERIWDDGVVRNILRDERYLGKNVYGKWDCTKVKDHHVHRIPSEDWIKVEHCHEPIISEAEFAAARESAGEYIQEKWRMPTIHLFSGKIQCEVCGHSLRYFKATTPYFRCMTRKYVGECSCMNGRIKEDELEVTVLSAIRLYVKVLLDQRVLQEQGNGGGVLSSLRKQLATMQVDNEKSKEQKALLYDQFADGKISREEFRKRQEAITHRQDDLQQRYDKLQKELSHLECITDAGKVQKKQWEDYLGAEKLTRGMVKALVDCIYVHQDGSIRIQWKFGDGVMGE